MLTVFKIHEFSCVFTFISTLRIEIKTMFLQKATNLRTRYGLRLSLVFSASEIIINKDITFEAEKFVYY